MPFRLDEIDVAVLESLSKNGRKSFRQISREIKVSTPTVKSHYERLVNVGLIKSVLPIIDFAKLEEKTRVKLDHIRQKTIKSHNPRFTKNMLIELVCDFCQGPVHDKPSILKMGNFERFFCCASCRMLYKEKHKGRIQYLTNNHSKNNDF